MITTHSREPRYQLQFTNGTQAADADAPSIKGGRGGGFGPHELLEASLATCINMWIRMQADLMGISVGPIAVTVNLRRDNPEAAFYEYTVKLDDALSEEQRSKLLQAADNCPVRRTLCKKPFFTRRDP
jgi:putative redox protein